MLEKILASAPVPTWLGFLARVLLYGYVVTRLLHFVAYFTKQTHDLRATLWTPSSLIIMFMAGWTLYVALGI